MKSRYLIPILFLILTSGACSKFNSPSSATEDSFGGEGPNISFSSSRSTELTVNVENENAGGRNVRFTFKNDSRADLAGLPLNFTFRVWRTAKRGSPEKESIRVTGHPSDIFRLEDGTFSFERLFGPGIYYWSIQQESPGGHVGVETDYNDPLKGNTFTIEGPEVVIDEIPTVPQHCKKKIYIGRGRWKFFKIPCEIPS